MPNNGTRGGSIRSHRKPKMIAMREIRENDRIEEDGVLYVFFTDPRDLGDHRMSITVKNMQPDHDKFGICETWTATPTSEFNVMRQYADMAEFTIGGKTVRVVVREERNGDVRLTLSGIDCDLDGDMPGSYVLV